MRTGLTTFTAEQGGTVYVLERSRAGSKRLVASSMPANRPVIDRPISLRKVPLWIRRAARQALD